MMTRDALRRAAVERREMMENILKTDGEVYKRALDIELPAPASVAAPDDQFREVFWKRVQACLHSDLKYIHIYALIRDLFELNEAEKRSAPAKTMFNLAMTISVVAYLLAWKHSRNMEYPPER